MIEGLAADALRRQWRKRARLKFQIGAYLCQDCARASHANGQQTRCAEHAALPPLTRHEILTAHGLTETDLPGQGSRDAAALPVNR